MRLWLIKILRYCFCVYWQKEWSRCTILFVSICCCRYRVFVCSSLSSMYVSPIRYVRNDNSWSNIDAVIITGRWSTLRWALLKVRIYIYIYIYMWDGHGCGHLDHVSTSSLSLYAISWIHPIVHVRTSNSTNIIDILNRCSWCAHCISQLEMETRCIIYHCFARASVSYLSSQEWPLHVCQPTICRMHLCWGQLAHSTNSSDTIQKNCDGVVSLWFCFSFGSASSLTSSSPVCFCLITSFIHSPGPKGANFRSATGDSTKCLTCKFSFLILFYNNIKAKYR